MAEDPKSPKDEDAERTIEQLGRRALAAAQKPPPACEECTELRARLKALESRTMLSERKIVETQMQSSQLQTRVVSLILQVRRMFEKLHQGYDVVDLNLFNDDDGHDGTRDDLPVRSDDDEEAPW